MHAGHKVDGCMSLFEFKHLLRTTGALSDSHGKPRLDIVPDVTYAKLVSSRTAERGMRFSTFVKAIGMIAAQRWSRCDRGTAVHRLVSKFVGTPAALDIDMKMLGVARAIATDADASSAPERTKADCLPPESPPAAALMPPVPWWRRVLRACQCRCFSRLASVAAFFASAAPGAVTSNDLRQVEQELQADAAIDAPLADGAPPEEWLTVTWPQVCLLAEASLTGRLHRKASSLAAAQQSIASALSPAGAQRRGLVAGEDLSVTPNLGNVMAIVDVTLEFVLNVALAFRGDALRVWKVGLRSTLAAVLGAAFFEDSKAAATAPPPAVQLSTSPSTTFLAFFLVCFALAVLFPLFAVKGVQMVKAGTLGMSDKVEDDGTRRKAPLLSWRGLYTKVLGVWASALYVPARLLVYVVWGGREAVVGAPCGRRGGRGHG